MIKHWSDPIIKPLNAVTKAVPQVTESLSSHSGYSAYIVNSPNASKINPTDKAHN
jgi:hypothetical protein